MSVSSFLLKLVFFNFFLLVPSRSRAIVLVTVALLISTFLGTVKENDCRTIVLTSSCFSPIGIQQGDVAGKGWGAWTLTTILGNGGYVEEWKGPLQLGRSFRGVRAFFQKYLECVPFPGPDTVTSGGLHGFHGEILLKENT